MTYPDDAVPAGLADLPLEVRREQEVDAARQLQEGLTRRHLAQAAEERAVASVCFASLLASGRSGHARG